MFTANTHRYDTFDERDYNLTAERSFKENFDIGLSAGIGAEFAITQHWLVRLEPRFRLYDLTNPNKTMFTGSQVNERYWAVGLNAGIYYAFGK